MRHTISRNNFDREHKRNTEQSPLVEITRILQAPVEWIWKAWSDSEIIKQWWGPTGYTSKYAETDFRIGGKYLFDMESPDGEVIWNTGLYEEIIPHQKIVYTTHFSDEDGNIILGKDIGMPGHWPTKLYVTIEFEKLEDNQTKMVLRHEGIPKEVHHNFASSWNQSLDKFQEIVERYGDEHFKSINLYH
jgi:uncharacterized protein YndB with AHSA1/START domain